MIQDVPQFCMKIIIIVIHVVPIKKSASFANNYIKESLECVSGATVCEKTYSPMCHVPDIGPRMEDP